MKIKILSFNEDTNEVELDLDDEGQTYLIKLGFETLLRIAMDAEEDDEKNR